MAWKYKNPGVIDEWVDNGIENVIEVQNNTYSRTGVGLTIENEYNKDTYIYIPDDLSTKKEFWIKCDFYGAIRQTTTGIYDDELGTMYHPNIDNPRFYCAFYSGCGDCDYKAGFSLNYNGSMSFGIDAIGRCADCDTSIDFPIVTGLHTLMMHIVSDATNGLFEGFIDNNVTPYYQHRGNIWNGDDISVIYLSLWGSVISNIVISNVQPNFNEVVPYNYYGINIIHADVMRFTRGVFYYEDPGDISNEVLFPYKLSPYRPKGRVYGKTMSRTGVACEICKIGYIDYSLEATDKDYERQYKSSSTIQSITEWCKDVWIQFDVYGNEGGCLSLNIYSGYVYDDGWSSRFTDYSYEWIVFKFSSSELSDGFVVNSDPKFDGNSMYPSDESIPLSLIGLHTIKVHVVSHKINGVMDVFIDNDKNPFYTFRGNVFDGEFLSHFFFGCFSPTATSWSNVPTCISNIIVSSTEPSINYVVPYTETEHPVITHADVERNIKIDCAWPYENPGIQDGKWQDYSNSLTEIKDVNISRTGTAITASSLWFNFPDKANSLREVWLKFDFFMYNDGENEFDFALLGAAYDWGNEVRIVYNKTTNVTDITFDILTNDGTEYDEELDRLKDAFFSATKHIPLALNKIHSIKIHIKDDGTDGSGHGTNGVYEVYIDNDTTPCYSYTGSVWIGNKRDYEYGEALYVSVRMKKVAMSNIVFSSEEVHIETLKEPSPIWRYENPGINDGKWGNVINEDGDLDTRAVMEIHNNYISRTGTAFTASAPETDPNLCYHLPDMAKNFDELWVKYDICVSNWERPYVWTGILCIDFVDTYGITYVYSDNDEVRLLKPNGKNIKVHLSFDWARTWHDSVLTYDIHTVMFHYVFGKNGLVEVYLDNDSTPIHSVSYTNYHPSDDTFGIEVCDVGISNIIISNVKPNFNEVVPSEYESVVYPTEGIATHKTVDLGAELTVGIGINIKGEGYAMIRTAGNDGRYNEWTNYVPCERRCRYIDVRLHVRGIITEATMVLDRQTVNKKITKHLSAGNNVVDYGETFYNVPAIMATAVGDGTTAYVVSKDKESCVIKLADNSNNTVEGDVDVLVRGW